jgi:hypothetical protein
LTSCEITPDASFIACFERLPERIRHGARRDYLLWRQNPNHPSLQFKKVGKKSEAYSVRVGIGWRALGIREQEVIVWFWIGSHAEYDQLVRRL